MKASVMIRSKVQMVASDFWSMMSNFIFDKSRKMWWLYKFIWVDGVLFIPFAFNIEACFSIYINMTSFK